MSSLNSQALFLLALSVFSFLQLERNYSESDFNDIVPLSPYHYSCAVYFTILTELE